MLSDFHALDRSTRARRRPGSASIAYPSLSGPVTSLPGSLPKVGSDVGRELLQALLDHFWECRRKRLPREPRLAPSGYLISYSSLVQRAGVGVEARRLGGPLAGISHLCDLKGWPPLAALVVRQDVGQPGVGYFRRPGSAKVDLVTEEHLRGWEADARACIAFERMPRRAPALEKAARR